MSYYYHFTSGNALKAICEHGLTIGDIPTDIERNRGVCGVWLTSDPNATGLGLAGSRLNKSRCRVQMTISDQSPYLHRWLDWAPRHVVPDTLDRLHATAGEGSDPSTWYVYLAWLKPNSIVSIADMLLLSTISDPASFWNAQDNVKPVRYRDKDRWHKGLMRLFSKRGKVAP